MEFQVFFLSSSRSSSRSAEAFNSPTVRFFISLLFWFDSVVVSFGWPAMVFITRAARKSIHFAVESQFIVFSSAVCRSSIWSIYLFFPASLRRRRTAGLRRDYWARYRGFHSHPNSTAQLSLSLPLSFSLKSIFMRFFDWKWESRAIRTTEKSHCGGGRDSLVTRNICALFHLIS